METYHLSDSEYRFMQVVWDAEPVGSGELVALCREKLGWKKSTTYTVLKKLCERGILHNANGTVTALVKQADRRRDQAPPLRQEPGSKLCLLCGRVCGAVHHYRRLRGA